MDQTGVLFLGHPVYIDKVVSSECVQSATGRKYCLSRLGFKPATFPFGTQPRQAVFSACCRLDAFTREHFICIISPSKQYNNIIYINIYICIIIGYTFCICLKKTSRRYFCLVRDVIFVAMGFLYCSFFLCPFFQIAIRKSPAISVQYIFVCWKIVGKTDISLELFIVIH